MAGAAFHKGPQLTAVFMVVLCTAGCVQREGRNSDCRWPGETSQHSVSPWHLSEDAEFAEDLAIRYADVHHGLRTPYYVSAADYNAARDWCVATLFEQVAKEHDVPVERVYSSLWHNRPYFDLAEVLSFALLYCFLAAAGARLIWRRYPPAEGWILCLVLMSVLAICFAVGGTMLGEVWSWFVEGYRMGNSHMSYRAQRLIWSRRPTELLVGAFALYWLAAVVARRIQSNDSLPGKDALRIE
jgi:hypothetical protein